MSEVEANTPVQTPTAEPMKDPVHDLEGSSPSAAPVLEEPAKPLSPPNPLPLPRRHLDSEPDEEAPPAKRAKNASKFDYPDPALLIGPDGKPLPPQEVFGEPAPAPPAEPDMDNLPENPMPKHQQKFALNTIKAIKRLRDAAPFLHPVDIVKLNIPYYYNYIPRPMDLLTIEKKIVSDAYSNEQELVDDFDLMVTNCKRFNGELSLISRMALNIQALFEKHILNFPPRDAVEDVVVLHKRKLMADLEEFQREARELVAAHRPKRTIVPPKPKELPYDVRPRKKKFAAELRFCLQTVKELMSKKHYHINFPFLAPVDTVALNIPHYFDVVKQPMDLGTISSNLANNQYENGDEFERDVRLVFANCYAFNPEGTDVHAMGKKLEAVFDKKWAQRPVPEPTPPALDFELDYDIDDEEFETRAEQMLAEVPAIQLLENQLKRMKLDLDKLKEQHLKQLREEFQAKRASRKGKKGKKMKQRVNGEVAEVNAGPVVTYEMKKQVLEMVPNLLEKKAQAVLKIIRDDFEIGNDDEIELDMDQLEDRTVLKLHNYLFGQKAAARMLGLLKRKQQKAGGLSADDELDHLRNQLALFDGELALAATNGLMTIGHESLDDDDLSSESLEEE